MKTKNIIWLLSLIILLGACSPAAKEPANQEFLTKIEYTNLSDESSLKELQNLLTAAGIAAERQDVLLNHINQFNSSVNREQLTSGYEIADILEPKYDAQIVQDQWMEKNPLFFGYNCRITSFGVFGDFIEIDKNSEKKESLLVFDLEALNQDNSAVQNGDAMDEFKVLYSSIPTVDGQDTNAHVEAVQKAWKERGIKFKDNAKARMISVFFQDEVESKDLFIGHVGILFPKSDNEFYFLEKISFQEPYQFIRFKNRVELNDYLMAKYDSVASQDTVRPFIMENDQLLKGYRLNPNPKGMGL